MNSRYIVFQMLAVLKGGGGREGRGGGREGGKEGGREEGRKTGVNLPKSGYP